MNRISSVLRFLIILLLTLLPMAAHAQELNCQVEVNSDQVSGTNRSAIDALKNSINEYMNTTVFTNAQFAPNEKIDCRLFLTLKEVNDQTYTGDLQIQATRPIYNASISTTLINFKDNKIEFTYQENEPLVFSRNSMESQLTAILNFYAYLILATDFDSFSPNGGQPYFDQLKEIVQMAQSSGESGWKAFEDTKNRSAVLTAYTDGTAGQAMRDLNYQYHRQGLDQMATAPDKGRTNITTALANLNKVYSTSPMSVALSMFKDAKLDELVNVYSKAPAEERARIYQLLQEIYPTEQTRLEEIKNGQQKR